MPLAASLPAPMAEMTVAAPVTASPPANTPSLLVMASSLMMMPPFLLTSRPSVVFLISGLGEVPIAMMTVSTSSTNSEPGISTVIGYAMPFAAAVLIYAASEYNDITGGEEQKETKNIVPDR